METGINLETKVDGEGVKLIEEAITTIFREGFANHIEQETIRKALDTLSKASSIGDVHVRNCNISG